MPHTALRHACEWRHRRPFVLSGQTAARKQNQIQYTPVRKLRWCSSCNIQDIVIEYPLQGHPPVGCIHCIAPCFALYVHRQEAFIDEMKPSKAVHLTLVTANGLKPNKYSGCLINVITGDDLFR